MVCACKYTAGLLRAMFALGRAVNSLADYTAAGALQSVLSAQRGRARSKDWRSGRPMHRRRHSADFSRRHRNNLSGIGRHSLDVSAASLSFTSYNQSSSCESS